MRLPIFGWMLCAAAAMGRPLASSAQTSATDLDCPPGSEQHLVPFDAPGAATTVSPICGAYCGTFAYANNDEGTVVGYYTDQYVVPHAFLRTPDGHFLSFEAPGAGLGHSLNEGTAAYSINGFGVIVGQYEDASFLYHAFIRYPDGRFTRFEAKDAGTVGVASGVVGTFAYSVNSKGETAGVYFDASQVEHGFVRSPQGNITEFDPTGSVSTMVCEETCLDPEGSAVGYYIDGTSTIHGFLRLRDGSITVIDAPGAGSGDYTGTIAASISADQDIGGYFVDSGGAIHSFVRHRDGSYTIFNTPKAYAGPGSGTAAFSINAWGATTGIYTDSGFVQHGFAHGLGGHFDYFDAPGAGNGAGQGTRPSTNNIAGEVTGWYIDSAGLNHGFVWRRDRGF